MKVSVITVAYNSERTIGETLQSVAEQSHPDIEHIVIDGASRDGTMSVVRQFPSSVSKVITEPDKGIYDAMNKGLALATGDLIGFLNADDTYANASTVTSLVEAAKKRPNACAIYGDLTYVSDGDVGRVIRLWRAGSFSHQRLRFGWMPPHPTFYIRAKCLRTVGSFNDQFRIAADYDFMLRTLSLPHAQAVYIPEVLVRMRAGGASNRSIKAMLRKSSEDLLALRQNKVGGWFALVCKNLRKIPQFFNRG